MFNPFAKQSVGDQTFLPEDYVERRIERRTNLISGALFFVVTLGVVGAFFVNNRQWNDVYSYQRAINVRYTQAAQDIEQLKTLESQGLALEGKAKIISALLERVPRSTLLAELINRMPKRVVLLEFDMASKRVASTVAQRQAGTAAPRSLTKGLAGGRPGEDESSADEAVQAPSFQTSVVMVGVAPDNRDVAQFVSRLHDCGFLGDVDLKFTETTMLKGALMVKFRVEASLRRDADARSIEVLEAPRLAGLEDEIVAGSRGGARAVVDGEE